MKKNDTYILVISGGGARGAYALGILKALEELGWRDRIEAVYGVSIGAIVGAYWTAGRKAEDIFHRIIEADFLSLRHIELIPKESLFSSQVIKDTLSKDLPPTFEALEKKLFVGTTDAWKAEYVLYNTGSLLEPLLGSMAIPGVFPGVPYQDRFLIDGGSINNFPVNLVKKHYANRKIMGIALNTFREKQDLTNVFNNILVSFEILLRRDIVRYRRIADILFYNTIHLNVLDNNKEKLHEAFEQGYRDAVKKLTNPKIK